MILRSASGVFALPFCWTSPCREVAEDAVVHVIVLCL